MREKGGKTRSSSDEEAITRGKAGEAHEADGQTKEQQRKQTGYSRHTRCRGRPIRHLSPLTLPRATSREMGYYMKRQQPQLQRWKLTLMSGLDMSFLSSFSSSTGVGPASIVSVGRGRAGAGVFDSSVVFS